MSYELTALPAVMMGATGMILSSLYKTDIAKLKPFSKDRSRKLAEAFLLTCPTFKFDGVENSIKLPVITVLPQLHCWKFTFIFDCHHSGYGDRRGQGPLQILSHHRIDITLENGRITGATIDDTWDELQQKSIH